MRPLTSIVLFLTIFTSYAQPVIEPGKGIGDLKIGNSSDQVIWTLGFRGIKLTKAGVPEVLNIQAEMLGIDYDYVFNYQHIMSLPISTVYFKNDKVVMIVVSSYPEYYQVICLGINTKEGLAFWDDEPTLKKIYGKKPQIYSRDFDFFFYKEIGLSISIEDKDIRTMTIFKSQS